MDHDTMKKIVSRIHLDFYLLFLVLIIYLLARFNYTPNTILSGWDTLHPEFDLRLYFSRIMSVWQEHQGLGAPPSQAHLAELPRMLFLLISSFLFPPEFIRYSYFFLMMFLGPTGIYMFIKHILSSRLPHDKQASQYHIVSISAFLGGLFYLLNLGSMQHFIVPLEMFATNYGLIGFIFLYITRYLEHGKGKDLLFLTIFTIFSAPMAHTATLWYTFFVGIALYVGAYWWMTRKNQGMFKKSTIVLTLILALNAYWILPNLYYSANYGKGVINSKIHRLFTEEAFFHNKKYGDLNDLLLMRNFLFDWRVTASHQDTIQSNYLLDTWQDHLKNPVIRYIGYFLALSACIGMYISFRKKQKILISLFPITAVAAYFLLSNEPLLSTTFELLRESNSVFKEALRFPFTKLSIYFIFSMALFSGYFHYHVLLRTFNLINEKARYFTQTLYFYFITSLVLLFALPAFQGHYISKVVRVQIPAEYNSMFNWFNKQDQGRVLTLPMNTLFGWEYYKWDTPESSQIYQGAGFSWFGIKQPTLNREFDRWYQPNEQSYREFSYALYSKNVRLFRQLLDKYHIEYVLMDKNIINADDQTRDKELFFPEAEKILKSISEIKAEQSFGKNIQVYSFNPARKLSDIVLLHNPAVVAPSYLSLYTDQAFLDNGTYISYLEKTNAPNTMYYPARNILNTQERINSEVLKIDKKGYFIDLHNRQFQGGSIHIPTLPNNETQVYTEVFMKQTKKTADVHEQTLQFQYFLPYFDNAETNSQAVVLPSKTSLISINKQVFLLPQLISEEPVYIGSSFLSTRSMTPVTFYESSAGSTVSPSIPKLFPYLCAEAQAHQVYGAEAKGNSLQMFGKLAIFCVDVPLTELVRGITFDEDGILHFKFNHQLQSATSGEICLLDIENNTCIKQLQISASDNTSELFVQIDNASLDSLYISFVFDARKVSEIKTMDLTIADAVFYKGKSSENITLKPPPLAKLKTVNSVQGELPQNHINLELKNLTLTKDNCGFEKDPVLDKRLRTVDGQEMVEYYSKEGSLCDSLPFPNLSQHTGYLIAVESQNTSGLPLKICFESDKTNTCVLKDELSKFKEFDTDYFIIPPYYDSFGYHLVLNNFSIGNTPSINRIRRISISSFPYNFFQSVRWQQSGIKGSVYQTSLPYSKLTPYLYVAQMPPDSDDETILTLNQAYEPNWKAYYVPSFIANTPVLRFMAPLFGKLLEHVSVNNWANGWVIAKNTEATQNSSIVILYTPQYLAFAGYFIFGITLFCILFTLPYVRTRK